MANYADGARTPPALTERKQTARLKVTGAHDPVHVRTVRPNAAFLAALFAALLTVIGASADARPDESPFVLDLGYDADGNRTSVSTKSGTDPAEVTTLTYDLRGQVRTVETPDGIATVGGLSGYGGRATRLRRLEPASERGMSDRLGGAGRDSDRLGGAGRAADWNGWCGAPCRDLRSRGRAGGAPVRWERPDGVGEASDSDQPGRARQDGPAGWCGARRGLEWVVRSSMPRPAVAGARRGRAREVGETGRGERSERCRDRMGGAVTSADHGNMAAPPIASAMAPVGAEPCSAPAAAGRGQWRPAPSPDAPIMARVDSTGALRTGAARPPPGDTSLDAFYDGLALVAERAPGDAELFARYHYDDGGLHAVTAEFAPDVVSTHTVHRGALGSTLLLTDGFGDAASSYRTDPWGSLEPAPSLDDPNALVFTGHQHDALTGLIYMKSRMYDPALGAFLTQDSYLGRIDLPASLHRYLYAYGNPGAWVDPDGYKPCSVNGTDFAAFFWEDCDRLYESIQARHRRTLERAVSVTGGVDSQGNASGMGAVHLCPWGFGSCSGEPYDLSEAGPAAARAMGVAQAASGVSEVAIGVTACLAPDPTFATKVLCAGAVAHGTDHTIAGVRSIWTGTPTRTATETVATWAAEEVGFSERSAHAIGTATDVALGFGLTLGTGTPTRAAVRGTGAGWFDDLMDGVHLRVDADDMPGIGSFGDEVHEFSVGTEGSGPELLKELLVHVDFLDVQTARNSAVFYSGPGNRALAEEFATLNERATLEMTDGGRWLDEQKLYGPSSPLTPQQADMVWGRLSERFAEGASGTVIGFVRGARPDRVFNRVEFPALLRNPTVVNVVTGGH